MGTRSRRRAQLSLPQCKRIAVRPPPASTTSQDPVESTGGRTRSLAWSPAGAPSPRKSRQQDPGSPHQRLRYARLCKPPLALTVSESHRRQIPPTPSPTKKGPVDSHKFTEPIWVQPPPSPERNKIALTVRAHCHFVTRRECEVERKLQESTRRLGGHEHRQKGTRLSGKCLRMGPISPEP